MAHSEKSQKEKTGNQRSDRFSEKFAIEINNLSQFYRVVSILNRELGHGNWTTVGRPVSKLRRVEHYNRIIFIGPGRSMDVVFCVPLGSETVATRLLLEMKYHDQ